MSNEQTMVAQRRQIRAIVKGKHAMLTLPDGKVDSIAVGEGEEIRTQIIRRAVAAARLMREPIDVTASGDIGEVALRVGVDGTVTYASEDDEQSVESDSGSEPEPVTEAVFVVSEAPETVLVEQSDTAPTATTDAEESAEGDTAKDESSDAVAAPSVDQAPVTRRARRSFIDTREPVRVEPTSGWRRIAAALGIKVEASPKEIARERDRRTVSVHHGGCRRIAVVNGKGGVGKTMSTAMLAAVYAREGGGGVLAWDNNPTRGSLGWRTEQAPHEATVQDVLEHAERLLDPTSPRALMAEFVHHQVDDRYDVLRSNPELLAIRQQIEVDEFDLISRVIDRNYRLVVFDSGNDESASRWLRMIDWSHQLVVPTTPSPESAESAMLLLQELSDRDEHSRELADDAVVVVTHNERNPGSEARDIVAGFEESGVNVLTVPFDPALKSGPLRFGLLEQSTRDAWLRVAAAAAAAAKF